MRSAATRPHLRGLALALGALLIAGLAAAAVTGAAPSNAAETGETPAIGATYEPEILGIPYGIWMPPTWEHVGDGGFNDDVVATGLRTVYTTGDKWNGTSMDLPLAKYVDGTLAWERLYDAPAHGFDEGAAIAARGAAIYTAGSRTTLRGDTDLLLIRWDSAGKRVWTRAYDSGSRMGERAVDVAVDSDGNVTVVGWSERPTTSYDWVVVSYKPDGTRRWVQRYDGPAHLNDTPNKMLIDSAGSIYVAGTSGSATNGHDALIAKYSKTGTRLWTKRYNGSADGADGASSLRARPGGGVYVAGYTNSSDTGQDGLLIAYTAAGTRLFAARDTDSEFFTDLEVLPGGDVICGGAAWSMATDLDRCSAIFSPSGELLDRVSEPGEGEERITAMAKDGQGGVYLTGTLRTDVGTVICTERICVGGTNWRSEWPGGSVLLGSDSEQLAATTDYRYAAIATNGVNAYVVGWGGGGAVRFVLGYVY